MNNNTRAVCLSPQKPICVLGDVRVGVMCFPCGIANVELRAKRRGYIPGESILFFVEVENNSSRILTDARVSLIQVHSAST